MKTAIIATILFFLVVAMATAATVTVERPLDDPGGIGYLYSLTPSNTFICQIDPDVDAGGKNMTLFFQSPYDNNTAGAWKINSTNTTVVGSESNINVSYTVEFVDGTTVTWGCYGCDNGTSCDSSVNRTLRVEYPPGAAISTPADELWNNSDLTYTITVTANASYADEDILYCRVWSNATGNWTKEPKGFTVANDTATTYRYTFPSDGHFLYSVKCREPGDDNVFQFTANQTIQIDRVAPTITVLPASGTTYTTEEVTGMSVVVTDANPHTCHLYTDFNNSWMLNESITSLTSGSVENFSTISVVNDGTFNFSVWCNDSAGNEVWLATNQTVLVDEVIPQYSAVANSTSPNCHSLWINVTGNSAVNMTLFYTHNASNMTAYATDFSKNQSALLYFGDNEETLFTFTIEVCDASGNCNSTPEYFTTTPVSVCTDGATNAGWQAYAVLTDDTTMGIVANESGADFVYLWNQTGQAWIYHQSATATRADEALVYGQAVFLYEATQNSTWFRPDDNTAGDELYNFTFGAGDNLVGLANDYTVYNLTVNSLNSSFSAVAYWNNSGREYVLGLRDSSWNNLTLMPRGSVLWVSATATTVWSSNASGLHTN